jgi:hypothetical protein
VGLGVAWACLAGRRMGVANGSGEGRGGVGVGVGIRVGVGVGEWIVFSAIAFSSLSGGGGGVVMDVGAS